jgi:hypothetical protein
MKNNNNSNIILKNNYDNNPCNANSCSFDKYNNNINFINNDENECLICLELKNDDETTVQLNETEMCSKKCLCSGWFHKKCLSKWFVANFTCPICRNCISSFKNQNVNQNLNLNLNQNVIVINYTHITVNNKFIRFLFNAIVYAKVNAFGIILLFFLYFFTSSLLDLHP